MVIFNTQFSHNLHDQVLREMMTVLGTYITLEILYNIGRLRPGPMTWRSRFDPSRRQISRSPDSPANPDRVRGLSLLYIGDSLVTIIDHKMKTPLI